MRCRRVAVGGIAGPACLAGGLLAALASGQAADGPVPITISVRTTVTPDRAGTPRHPWDARIDVKATICTGQVVTYDGSVGCRS